MMLSSTSFPALSTMPTLHIDYVLLDSAAKVPARGTTTDAAYDLSSCEQVTITPGKRALINTGLSINIPPGFVGYVCARSGLAVKNGIIIGAGVIDPGYTGPIKILLFNAGELPFVFGAGDRIAQILFMPRLDVNFISVDSHDATDRGAKGFGSTGV